MQEIPCFHLHQRVLPLDDLEQAQVGGWGLERCSSQLPAGPSAAPGSVWDDSGWGVCQRKEACVLSVAVPWGPRLAGPAIEKLVFSAFLTGALDPPEALPPCPLCDQTLSLCPPSLNPGVPNLPCSTSPSPQVAL